MHENRVGLPPLIDCNFDIDIVSRLCLQTSVRPSALCVPPLRLASRRTPLQTSHQMMTLSHCFPMNRHAIARSGLNGASEQQKARFFCPRSKL